MISEFVEIANNKGLIAKLIPFSATLARVTFPDKNGAPTDLVLGYNSIDEFKQDKFFMGKTIGRVANRIKDGRFEFGGRLIEVSTKTCLHGGPDGPCFKDWSVVRQSPESVSFSCTVREVEDGFPGDARIDVTYTVNDKNQLIIEHFAQSLEDSGVLALTNHAYWNLDGGETMMEHLLNLDADRIIEIDGECCSTGKISHIENGHKWDFQKPKTLQSAADNDGIARIDHDFILKKCADPVPKNHLRFFSPKSGIEMAMMTSYPCVHLYTSHFLEATGRNGEFYGPNKAIAIEPQYHSCAVNYPNLHNITLNNLKNYTHEIVFTFTTLNDDNCVE